MSLAYAMTLGPQACRRFRWSPQSTTLSSQPGLSSPPIRFTAFSFTLVSAPLRRSLPLLSAPFRSALKTDRMVAARPGRR